MNQTDFTIAPFHITDDKSCMAMISDGMIHFFAINGQSIDRKDLNLPEVFVLCFNNGTSRSYVMVNEKEECKEGKIYVINKDNRVIFTSDDKELGTFYRLTDDSVILGIKDIITSSNLLTSSNNKFGHLIANNELTDCQYIGTIGDFIFFVAEIMYITFIQLIFSVYQMTKPIVMNMIKKNGNTKSYQEILFKFRRLIANILFFGKQQVHICHTAA